MFVYKKLFFSFEVWVLMLPGLGWGSFSLGFKVRIPIRKLGAGGGGLRSSGGVGATLTPEP